MPQVSHAPDGSTDPSLTHPLTTNNIREPTEEKLTDKSTNRGRDLDPKILVRREGLRARVISADYRPDMFQS